MSSDQGLIRGAIYVQFWYTFGYVFLVFSNLEVDLGQFGVQNRFLRVKLCILASGNVSRSISGSKKDSKKSFDFLGVRFSFVLDVSGGF